MNNLGWAMKPFSKLIGLAADTSVTIDLNDTNGDTIKCNYVTVQASNGTSVGPYNVRPVVTYFDDSLEASSTGSIETEAGAGCAIGLAESTVPTILRTSANEFFEQIVIDNDSTGQCNFVITYGVVYAASPMETLKVKTRGK